MERRIKICSVHEKSFIPFKNTTFSLWSDVRTAVKLNLKTTQIPQQILYKLQTEEELIDAIESIKLNDLVEFDKDINNDA